MRSWEAIRVRRADVEDRWSGRIGREHLQHAVGARRARHPRRGEAGGSCRSSRLGGGAWVRPLGYKTLLYSSDDPW